MWYSWRRNRASCNPMMVLEKGVGTRVRVCVLTVLVSSCTRYVRTYSYICTVGVCICTGVIHVQDTYILIHMYYRQTHMYKICTVKVCISTCVIHL